MVARGVESVERLRVFGSSDLRHVENGTPAKRCSEWQMGACRWFAWMNGSKSNHGLPGAGFAENVSQ